VIIFYSFYCRFKKSWISIHHGKVLIWFWRLLFVFVLPFLFVFAFVLSLQTIGKRFSSFCRCFIDSVEFKLTNSNFLPKFCSTQIIFLYLSWLMKRSFKKGLKCNEMKRLFHFSIFRSIQFVYTNINKTIQILGGWP